MGCVFVEIAPSRGPHAISFLSLFRPLDKLHYARWMPLEREAAFLAKRKQKRVGNRGYPG